MKPARKRYLKDGKWPICPRCKYGARLDWFQDSNDCLRCTHCGKLMALWEVENALFLRWVEERHE